MSTVQPQVTVVEVGPRDGFQMEETFIPTALKIEIVNLLTRSGLRKIEVTSFVSPKVIPQLRDADVVMREIGRAPGVAYNALVPNLKGAERAATAGADTVRVVVCASETYNRRNVGMSIAESLADCDQVLGLAGNRQIGAEAVIALAFGCPLEGPVPEARVLDLVAKLGAMGYREISIADSAGLASPLQVQRVAQRLREEFEGIHFSLHIHNTRGLGLANVLAAWQAGIDTFDSSLGGLGGCPVVAGGTGNIATEDLVNMFTEMGIYTGVDLEGVLQASRLMQDFLRRTLPSSVLKAGTRTQLFRRLARARQVA